MKSMISIYLNDIFISLTDDCIIVLCVLQKYFVHIRAGILVELVVRCENDQSNFTVTQHTEFIGLLHQTKLSFCESHLKTTPECYFSHHRGRNVSEIYHTVFVIISHPTFFSGECEILK